MVALQKDGARVYQAMGGNCVYLFPPTMTNSQIDNQENYMAFIFCIHSLSQRDLIHITSTHGW